MVKKHFSINIIDPSLGKRLKINAAAERDNKKGCRLISAME